MPKKYASRVVFQTTISCVCVIVLIAGCRGKEDPDSYFNPATQEVEVRACIDKLKPMIEDIQRRKLDHGNYVPGTELTIKNTTFGYYQRLVSGYRKLPTYLSWKSLTPEEKEQAFYFHCPLPSDFINHEVAINKEIADVEALFKKKLSYQTVQENVEEGLKSRDEWDKIVREDIPVRRKKLQSVSVNHTMSNRNGIRIDSYQMKNGSLVICSTTVHPSAGPNMNCDGEP